MTTPGIARGLIGILTPLHLYHLLWHICMSFQERVICQKTFISRTC